MVTIKRGERIARSAALRLSCAAAVVDEGGRILLTQRADNMRWCLPGGAMEPGESAAEACAREVHEETGLSVEVTRLIGVYSDPHRIFQYQDGNRWHVVELLFSARPRAGSLIHTPEIRAARYFLPDELIGVDLMEHDRDRLDDVFAQRAAAFMR